MKGPSDVVRTRHLLSSDSSTRPIIGGSTVLSRQIVVLRTSSRRDFTRAAVSHDLESAWPQGCEEKEKGGKGGRKKKEKKKGRRGKTRTSFLHTTCVRGENREKKG